ncbi:MAG: ABC transporter transmembrane domain-containing protein [Alphaproteobacteria bacterium]
MLISLLGKRDDPWSVRCAISASRELLRAVFVFSLFLNVLMLTGSIYMLQIYDRVLPSTSGATLLALTLLAAALYAASGCLDFARSVILRHLGHRLERKAGPAVLRGIIAASVALPGRRSDQPLRDLSALRQFISGQAPVAVFDLPWAPFYLVIVFLLHWTLGVVALFATGVLLALAWANRSATETLLAEGNQHAIKSSAMAASWVRNAEALVAMGMGERARRPLASGSARLRRARARRAPRQHIFRRQPRLPHACAIADPRRRRAARDRSRDHGGHDDRRLDPLGPRARADRPDRGAMVLFHLPPRKHASCARSSPGRPSGDAAVELPAPEAASRSSSFTVRRRATSAHSCRTSPSASSLARRSASSAPAPPANRRSRAISSGCMHR